jgi:GT2 family glycosyltransferase
MTRAHVTLAVLTRNRPELLPICLDAALAAREPPDSILVSDDSGDDIRPQNRAIAEGRGVEYTEGPRRGLGANENHIVESLPPHAEWVVFIGDDARLTDDYMVELRAAIARHAPHRRIPTGAEVRNGEWVVPSRLGFLGFQDRPHADYTPGAPMETVVVQSTPWPVEVLREVRWLEVSPYGCDEIDMAHKARRLGWTIAFEPRIWLHHDQSDTGRDEYPAPAQIARLYFRARSFTVYRRSPLRLAAFLVLAPLHLVAAHARRRDWAMLRATPALTWAAYSAWLRSLRRDWRLG